MVILHSPHFNPNYFIFLNKVSVVDWGGKGTFLLFIFIVGLKKQQR